MTITITKSKPKAKQAAPSNVIDTIVQKYVMDRLNLEHRLAKLAALQSEVDAGEKQLLEYTDILVDSTQSTELQAEGYVVKIGPKGRKATAFDNAAIRAEIGEDTYDAIATFRIEDLKKYMTGESFAKAVTYANVNKRKVVIEEAQSD